VTALRFDLSVDAERETGMDEATRSVQRGRLVVLPTDTVYGVGCDAFNAQAVQRLLDAKGRGREMPPPVLVSAKTTLEALAIDVPDWARALVDELWPGPLTLVLRQQASLQWDLGETRGTVAVRMPDHDAALELLARTGPLAVSSANLSGEPAATDADEAERMLGEAVRVILDGGATPGPIPSTIVDCTGEQGRLLRSGVVPLATLNEVVAPMETAILDA
jgi:tRNA threonylcarbamoyl adenosine modification protein (Sua5/YciO/YrdC/YwlC family)